MVCACRGWTHIFVSVECVFRAVIVQLQMVLGLTARNKWVCKGVKCDKRLYAIMTILNKPKQLFPHTFVVYFDFLYGLYFVVRLESFCW